MLYRFELINIIQYSKIYDSGSIENWYYKMIRFLITFAITIQSGKAVTAFPNPPSVWGGFLDVVSVYNQSQWKTLHFRQFPFKKKKEVQIGYQDPGEGLL